MTIPLEFQQAIFWPDGTFGYWHCWGFINEEFIAPLIGRISKVYSVSPHAEVLIDNQTPAQAQANSYQWTGLYDATEWCELTIEAKDQLHSDSQSGTAIWPGRKVYDGDRVRVIAYCDESPQVKGIAPQEVEVKYHQTWGFGFKYKRSGTCRFIVLGDFAGDIKVIGNIVENAKQEDTE